MFKLNYIFQKMLLDSLYWINFIRKLENQSVILEDFEIILEYLQTVFFLSCTLLVTEKNDHKVFFFYEN